MQMLKGLFFPGGFMPHGYCYLWTRNLIALSYLSIPITLVAFARRQWDIPFSWMFLFFGAFIRACGGTHVVEVWTIWVPSFWLPGALKAGTASFSVVITFVIQSPPLHAILMFPGKSA
jgi:hypothetical protein